MRKIRMTSSTSISGMKLISGCSRPLVLRRFIALSLLALAVREIDELDRLLLHLDMQAVDRGAEVAVEDHARARDDNPGGGVVETNRDAMRKLQRIRAGRGLRTENLDHADHGAEQTEQRRHRRDRAERCQKSLEIVSDHTPGLLDRLAHHGPRALDVGEAGGEDAAERTLLRGLREKLCREPGMPVFGQHAIDESRRSDPAAA